MRSLRLCRAAGFVLALGLTLFFVPRNAQAQQAVKVCLPVTAVAGSLVPAGCYDVSASNPLPVSASVTASVTGFAPASTGTPISVTTGGVTGSLPTGAVVVASNVGTTNVAYCKLGASATTSDQVIAPNGGWFAFTVGAATQLTCITDASTTTINMVGGTGLPTGTSGSGGSSAANASVAATGAAVPASATYVGITSGGNLTGWTGAVTQATAANLNATVVGTGTFATQAAQSGTWNITNVSGTVSLPTGAATAAKQPALGTAGTASADVLTIQGIASMTPLQAAESGTWNITNVSGTVSLPTGAATSALQTTGNTSLATIATNTAGPYPAGATAITASATGTTGATTATLAGISNKTTYICSLSIRANANAAATADSTVTGTITGTLHYTQWTAPNTSGIGLTEQLFIPCVPASATNTGIAVISAAPGTGGVVSVTATGFQL